VDPETPRMRTGRGMVHGALAVLLLVATAPIAHAAAAGSSVGAPRCGQFDRPETGLQGEVPLADQLSGRAFQGYNCGVDVVGHDALGGSGGNANMAWVGNCAYVASTGLGVAVVDVSNPRSPRMVGRLHGPGSDLTIETIAAVEVGGRAALAAGRYGLTPIPNHLPVAPVDLYDVSGDCTHPRLRSTYYFQQNVHNLRFSADGKRLFSTLPIQAIDVSDLSHPQFLGNLDDQIPEPTIGKYLSHEVEISPDGNRIYIGGQTPMFSYFTIVDITGWPARPARVLAQTDGRGHSVRLAKIGGRQYVLHSEESIVGPTAKGCLSERLNPFAGASQPWLSDVTDPRHPKMRVSQFKLAINNPANCLREALDGEDASVHYHDVDNPTRTTFAMLSMWNAGLRIVDLRDPLHQREVAYFNPGAVLAVSDSLLLDKAWGHIRYLPESGQIWFATQSGGFWVVELEPQVRHALGLPTKPSLHPEGAPVRPVGSALHLSLALGSVAPVEYYCTIRLV